MATSIIEINDVKKSFQVGTQEVSVLRGVTAQINMGDFVIIVGPSGCGKSTLLHIILGLEHPSDGNIVFLGENIYQNTTEDYRSDFRKKHIGMVYQQPNWVKSMTVAENVAFPMLLLGMETDAALERARELLGKLRMADWANYMPSELSGGQQQRVSLARALANNPEIIIADEPTGNLDYQTGQEVMQMLQDLNTKEQKTVVMVTHDLEYLKFANTAIKIFDGTIEAVYTGTQINDLFANSKQKRGVGQISISTATKVTDKQKTPAPPVTVVTTDHTAEQAGTTTETTNNAPVETKEQPAPSSAPEPSLPRESAPPTVAEQANQESKQQPTAAVATPTAKERVANVQATRHLKLPSLHLRLPWQKTKHETGNSPTPVTPPPTKPKIAKVRQPRPPRTLPKRLKLK